MDRTADSIAVLTALVNATRHPEAVHALRDLRTEIARWAELEQAAEFDGIPYLRLAITRTQGDQQTVTFRRETLVQAVRQTGALEAALDAAATDRDVAVETIKELQDAGARVRELCATTPIYLAPEEILTALEGG